MTISNRRYVDISTTQGGAAAVPLQRLDLRIFTDAEELRPTQVLEFPDAQSVGAFFGSNSAEAKIAASYFGYISPAPASRAKALQFARHAVQDVPPITISLNDGGDITAIQNLGASSSITITIDGTPVAKTVDLLSPVSFSDVATTLTNAYTSEGLAFTYASGVFVCTATGGTSVDFPSSGFADLVGFTGQDQDPGQAQETMAESFARSREINDSFGSLIFTTNAALILQQVEDLAAAVAAENVRYQLYVDVSPTDAAAWSAALIDTASTGLILRRPEDAQTLAWLPAAVMSATNYDLANASTNYMYREGGTTVAPQVTTNLAANNYDALRINYYGQTAVAGRDKSFFQRGYLCGGSLAPLDMSVHANEQWFKSYITQQWFSLLLATRGIPANRDGRGRMMAVIAGAVTKAIDNGTILIGKTLSEVQKAAIYDATGDPLAWMDVQSKGYWYDVRVVETSGPVAEYKGVYVVVYAKSDWVRKIEGSHNLI